MATDEDYFRKYLLDPTAIQQVETPQQVPATEQTDTNVNYYRKYLLDPNA